MNPRLLSFFCLFLLLLGLPAFCEEQKLTEAQLLDDKNFTTLQRGWKQSGVYPKKELITYLKSPKLQVRCRVLDLLEPLAGNDFGLDPWLDPDTVTHEVRAAWTQWAEDTAPIPALPSELSMDETEKMLGLYLSGNTLTRHRLAEEFIEHKDKALVYIEAFLQKLSPEEQSQFKTIKELEFRIYLHDLFSTQSESIAKKLMGHNRDDLIETLESFRKKPKALPVIETYLTHADPLVRETAVDLYISLGEKDALAHIMPLLIKETDPNVLQIAFRRSVNYPSAKLSELLYKAVLGNNEDLALSALQTLLEQKEDKTALTSIFSKKTGFTDDNLITLLNHPEWRIRQAILDYIYKTKYNVNKGSALAKRIIELFSDEEDTVRFAAFCVGTTFSLKDEFKRFEEIAFNSPKHFPPILYIFMLNNVKLSSPMQDLIKRLPLDPVNDLIQQEKSLSPLLTAPYHQKNKTTLLVTNLLLQNTHPEAKEFFIHEIISSLDNDSYKELFFKIMKDESVSPDKKLNLLTKIQISRYSDLGENLIKYHNKDKISTDKPFLQNLSTLLESLAEQRLDPKKSELGWYALELLVKTNHEKATQDVLSHMNDYPDKIKSLLTDSILKQNNIPHAHLLDFARNPNPEIRREAAAKILSQTKTAPKLPLPDLDNIYAEGEDEEANLHKTIKGYKSDPEAESLLNKLFTDPQYGKDHWCQLIQQWTHDVSQYGSIYRQYYTNFGLYLYHADKNTILNSEIRASAAFVKAFYFPPDKNEKHYYPDNISATSKELLDFAYEHPKLRKELLPWAQKWSSSSIVEIRLNLASLLLYLDQINFYFPLGESHLIKIKPETLTNNLYFKSRYVDTSDSELPECPSPLMSLIWGMTKDPSPLVRSQAHLSIWSNTQYCDFNNLLQTFKRLTAEQKNPNIANFLEKHPQLISSIYKAQFSPSSYVNTTSFYKITKPVNISASQIKNDASIFLTNIRTEAFPDNDWYFNIDPQKSTNNLLSFNELVENKTDSSSSSNNTYVQGPPNPNLHILAIFFEKPGCSDCLRVEKDLHDLKEIYPNLRIKKYSITERNGIEYNALLCNRFNVKNNDRLIAPAIFTGEGTLTRNQLSKNNIKNLIEANSRPRIGSPEPTADMTPAWAINSKLEQQQAQSDIQRTYDDMSLGVVIFGGLIDGINPCAFATLIFFLSYLQIARRTRRELLWTGLAFIISVYLTYFIIGLAFNEIIGYLQEWSFLKRFMDIGFFSFALLAAFLSFRDAARAKRGELSDMTLTLPNFIKKRIHSIIREQSKARNIILASAFSGVIISALELACTGQVYAPIIYQINQGNYSASGMLALYNLAFILPLVIIFFFTYRGLKTETLLKLQQKHTYRTKILLGLVFLLLALFILVGAL